MNHIEIEMKYKITEEIYDNIIKYFETINLSSKEEYQNDIYFSPIYYPFFGGKIDKLKYH